jgi:hypothetical protein
MISRFKLRVDVTEQDIAEAHPFSACDCPIAVRLRKLLPVRAEDDVLVSTGVGRVTFRAAERLYGANLPKDALAAANVYDRDCRMKPFTFWLNFEVSEWAI